MRNGRVRFAVRNVCIEGWKALLLPSGFTAVAPDPSGFALDCEADCAPAASVVFLHSLREVFTFAAVPELL